MRSLSADRHKCPSLEPNFFSPELMLAQYTVVNIYAVLIATPEAVLASVRAIYCNGYNEENQVSEKQYFHVAQAYF